MPSEKKPEQRTLELLFAPRAETAKRADDPAEAAAPVSAAPSLPGPTAPPPARPPNVAMQQVRPSAVAAPLTPATTAPAVPVAAATDGPRTYKVSELVRLAGRSLEARFADVWVEGEISNLKQPGHAYFTLKDAEGQLPSVMFRAALSRLRFRLSDGLKVRARGRLSIYDVQGKLQLYVEALEPAGLGALQLAFEQLKRRLAAEGLFAEARKRPLPFLPRRIGIATSATGAAVRDIIRVAQMRGPTRLVVASCLVQGEEAPADIARAIAALERVPDVDLIIVGRGGGSVEDLWAFNDERVARAIAGCRVPVLSAVGHEVDYTIADFVADRRAATPSQAAEIAVPVHRELLLSLRDLSDRLVRAGGQAVGEARLGLDGEMGVALDAVERKITGERRRLTDLTARLRSLHPSARLGRDRALLVALHRRLERPLPERFVRARRGIDPLRGRLLAAMQQTWTRAARDLEALVARLGKAMAGSLSGSQSRLASYAGTLDALSPLRVLDRGYGLVIGPAGHVVTRPAELTVGDRIRVRFARGHVDATVLLTDEPAEQISHDVADLADPVSTRDEAPAGTRTKERP